MTYEKRGGAQQKEKREANDLPDDGGEGSNADERCSTVILIERMGDREKEEIGRLDLRLQASGENQGKIYLNTSEVRAATGFEGEAVGDHGCDCLGLQGRWITVPKGDSGGFFRSVQIKNPTSFFCFGRIRSWFGKGFGSSDGDDLRCGKREVNRRKQRHPAITKNFFFCVNLLFRYRLRSFQRIRKNPANAPANNGVRSSDDREDSGAVFKRKD
ncbi:hypothetical protein U1Q18_022435 [Sarracenia purpurea var. burkii]